MGILSSALNAEVEEQAELSAEFKLGGKTFKVGSRPLTATDLDHANSQIAQAAQRLKIGYVPFQQDPTNFTGQVAILIRKTYMLDDEGVMTSDRAFSVSDKPVLMRAGIDKVSEMFADLFKDQVQMEDEGDVETLKGN